MRVYVWRCTGQDVPSRHGGHGARASRRRRPAVGLPRVSSHRPPPVREPHQTQGSRFEQNNTAASQQQRQQVVVAASTTGIRCKSVSGCQLKASTDVSLYPTSAAKLRSQADGCSNILQAELHSQLAATRHQRDWHCLADAALRTLARPRGRLRQHQRPASQSIWAVLLLIWGRRLLIGSAVLVLCTSMPALWQQHECCSLHCS